MLIHVWAWIVNYNTTIMLNCLSLVLILRKLNRPQIRIRRIIKTATWCFKNFYIRKNLNVISIKTEIEKYFEKYVIKLKLYTNRLASNVWEFRWHIGLKRGNSWLRSPVWVRKFKKFKMVQPKLRSSKSNSFL